MGRWGWGKGKSIFAQARAIVPLTTPTHLLAHRACWLRRWSSGGVDSRFRPLTGADARARHPKKHVGASRVPPLPRPPFMVCRGCRRDAVRPLTVTATSAITCFHCYRHRYRHRHRTTATVPPPPSNAAIAVTEGPAAWSPTGLPASREAALRTVPPPMTGSVFIVPSFAPRVSYIAETAAQLAASSATTDRRFRTHRREPRAASSGLAPTPRSSPPRCQRPYTGEEAPQVCAFILATRPTHTTVCLYIQCQCIAQASPPLTADLISRHNKPPQKEATTRDNMRSSSRSQFRPTTQHDLTIHRSAPRHHSTSQPYVHAVR